jgi:hypothetical protein
MKGEALWARPCIRGRTGILELKPKVSECAAAQPPGPLGRHGDAAIALVARDADRLGL